MQNENNLSLLRRLWIYQKERFPLVSHGLLISTFTFSAVSYSLMCRGVDEFIAWREFLPGLFITFSLFFLLRLFDEFKDKEDDAKYRTYLPVPRGLVSLKELRILMILVFIAQFIVIYFFQFTLAYLYVGILFYLLLMRVEFFVPTNLKKHQVLYITSHMFIMPFVDIYASAMDWKLANASPSMGLIWFFVLSYLNGLVLEIGRKMKAEEKEEYGVVSYTKLWGRTKAVVVWFVLISLTLASAFFAANFAHYNTAFYLVLAVCFTLCVIPAIVFLKNGEAKWAKGIEVASGIWAILMYLSLGAIPMLSAALSH